MVGMVQMVQMVRMVGMVQMVQMVRMVGMVGMGRMVGEREGEAYHNPDEKAMPAVLRFGHAPFAGRARFC